MKMQLVITLNERGEVRVDGPLREKIICYGMLEAARHAIDHSSPPPLVTPPEPPRIHER